MSIVVKKCNCGEQSKKTEESDKAILPKFVTMPHGWNPNPQVTQPRPIPMGVSIGSVKDLFPTYCCGGTLGYLMTDGTAFYMLSCAHVFAGEFYPDGTGVISAPGDQIIQPGGIDVGCEYIPADVVGLLEFSQMPETYDPSEPHFYLNVFDAAIAPILTGQVSTDGYILNIGTLQSTPVSAYLNLQVQKCGRTTALTTGFVSGLDATIFVNYLDQCNSSTGFTAQFIEQIVISPDAGVPAFGSPGDSGSGIVTNLSTISPPAPVGMLFAGGGGYTFANDMSLLAEIWLGGALSFVGSADPPMENVAAKQNAADDYEKIRIIKRTAEKRWFKDYKYIAGCAIHLHPTKSATLVIMLYLTEASKETYPTEVEGVTIMTTVTGPIKAL